MIQQNFYLLNFLRVKRFWINWRNLTINSQTSQPGAGNRCLRKQGSLFPQQTYSIVCFQKKQETRRGRVGCQTAESPNLARDSQTTRCMMSSRVKKVYVLVYLLILGYNLQRNRAKLTKWRWFAVPQTERLSSFAEPSERTLRRNRSLSKYQRNGRSLFFFSQFLLSANAFFLAASLCERLRNPFIIE